MVRLFSLIAFTLAVATPALAQTGQAAAPEINSLGPSNEANGAGDVRSINALLDQFNAAAARADGPAYFASFTPNAVFVGTDATERWTLTQFRAFAEPYFAQGKGWTYTPTSRTVTFADMPCRCVAWFEENLHSDSYGTTRGTGMVVKGADGWKIGQYVLTIPLPNDISKDLVAEIKAYEAAHPAPAH